LHYRVRAVKLLAFSDLHRARGRARRLAARAGEADVVVGAGDFASFHLGLRRTIEPLSSISTPSVLVPGNNESASALWRACADWPSAVILHGDSTTLDGVTFYGLGGGVPVTPFPWGFDLSEEEAAEKLSDCPDGAVLVIHSPPKGFVDEAFGRHLGSEAILATIEAKRPPLAICGHIHQCWGREAQIGPTRLINVGPDGIMLEL
jgi:Icc-related predicted phosphoesterase